MRRVGLGHDEQARRVAIQAVHDSRAPRPARRGESDAETQQAVDQRPVGLTVPRMNDQVDRFVDDDEVVVLVDHGDLDRLGLRCGRRRRGNRDLDAGACAKRRTRLGGRGAVDRDEAVVDPARQGRAGAFGKPLVKESIEARSRGVRPDLQPKCLFAACGHDAAAARRDRRPRISIAVPSSTPPIANSCEVDTASEKKSPRPASPR